LAAPAPPSGVPPPPPAPPRATAKAPLAIQINNQYFHDVHLHSSLSRNGFMGLQYFLMQSIVSLELEQTVSEHQPATPLGYKPVSVSSWRGRDLWRSTRNIIGFSQIKNSIWPPCSGLPAEMPSHLKFISLPINSPFPVLSSCMA
jgi:hypothetical protein